MEFSKELITVLDYLGTKFGVAIDWTSSNVLPYLKELMGKYISWEVATSTFWICFAGIVCIISILLIILDRVYWDECLPTVIGCALIFGCTLAIGSQIYDIITCKYFPEMQIMEYIQYLSNNK